MPVTSSTERVLLLVGVDYIGSISSWRAVLVYTNYVLAATPSSAHEVCRHAMESVHWPESVGWEGKPPFAGWRRAACGHHWSGWVMVISLTPGAALVLVVAWENKETLWWHCSRKRRRRKRTTKVVFLLHPSHKVVTAIACPLVPAATNTIP
jgi:hypothetical protein